MRLQVPESSETDTFSLILSPAEWKDIHGLAQFAERGLGYDLLKALHNDNALVIDLKATNHAVVTLDVKQLPPESRAYVEGKMRDLVAQNPELYADGQPDD